MVINTRKMNKIQQTIYDILNEEMFLSVLFEQLVETSSMNLEELEEFRKVSKQPDLYRDEIKFVSKDEIMRNPYLQNISFPNIQDGDISLSKRRIIRTGFIARHDEEYRDLSTMRIVNSYFYSDKSLHLPAIVEGDGRVCWMTVEPFEINSFKKIIDEASGDVLLFGCGLGYLPYMLSLKEDVRSITIVDSNEDVLSLFNDYILPQFENKNKITTHKFDAMEFLNKVDLSNFDYINVDIWYDVYDMIYTYLRCLNIERNNPSVKFSYWIEQSLKQAIQKSILSAFSGYPATDLLIDKIGQDLVKNTAINCYEDLYNLVDIKDLRTFLYDWYCKNSEVVDTQEKIDMEKIKKFHASTSQKNNDSANMLTFSRKYKI